jgi:hypothetical protein
VSDSIYIEFRLRGYARHYARWVKARLKQQAKKLQLKNILKEGHVSHITLFGPARTNHRQQVIQDIIKTSRHYTIVPFHLGGFDGFLNKDAIYLYFVIQPSSDLVRYRCELAESLIHSHNMIANTCTPFDKSYRFRFHSTIGKYPPKEKARFEKLLQYAHTNCSLDAYQRCKRSVFEKVLLSLWDLLRAEQEKDKQINLHLLRTTIIGGKSHIVGEYDLILNKMLSRKEAFSRYWYKKTLAQFKLIRAKGLQR